EDVQITLREVPRQEVELGQRQLDQGIDGKVPEPSRAREHDTDRTEEREILLDQRFLRREAGERALGLVAVEELVEVSVEEAVLDRVVGQLAAGVGVEHREL